MHIHEQALALFHQAQFNQAEVLLQKHLQIHKSDHKAISLLGHALMNQQRLDAAVTVFQRNINLQPEQADALVDLAQAYQQQQQHTDAIATLKKALAINESHHQAWQTLGNLLMHTAEIEEGKTCFDEARRTDPFAPHIQQITEAVKQQDFNTAESLCKDVLQQHGHHPEALLTLAELATQQNQWQAAEQMLQHALDYAPFHFELWQALADVSSYLGKHEQRIYAAQQCTKLSPNNALCHSSLGSSLASAAKYEEALHAYDQASSLNEQDANIHIQRGHILKTLGRRDEAVSAFRHSLDLFKKNGVAYWALADLKNFDFSDVDIDTMKSIVDDQQSSAEQRSQAGFALANALERQGDYETAFHYYSKANHLRPDAHFDPAHLRASFQEGKALFNKALLQSKPGFSHNSAKPIFIVGLPRSGSTLIEQILSSHSQIDGTLELPNLPRVMETLYQESLHNKISMAELLARMTPEHRAAYGQKYLDETAIFRNDNAFFIDKLPPNFKLVGFIHLILPDAIIIDARRNPLDTGLSAFKQHFAAGHEFSYKLEHIGSYYNEYLSMMDHWDDVLPNKVYCQHYSDLVTNTEENVRKLLQHCGLDFEEQCLNFYNNKRAVHTASSEQVRQPIYLSGLDYWKNFEPWLEPLMNSLGPETIQRA